MSESMINQEEAVMTIWPIVKSKLDLASMSVAVSVMQAEQLRRIADALDALVKKLPDTTVDSTGAHMIATREAR